MRLTLRHVYDFGADRHLVGDNLIRPGAWDALRLSVTEDHPLVPVDVNGIILIAGESYHLLYHDVHGIRATSLRLTNTYGPHQLMKHGRQGFITVFIRLAMEGKPIRVWGDGGQLRDFTYVTDAVDAFLRAAQTEKTYGQALNVGGIEPISLLDVATACQKELTGWRPETGLREGLKRTMAFYGEHGEHYWE